MTTSDNLRGRLVEKRLIGFDVLRQDDADDARGSRSGAKLTSKVAGKPDER